MRKILLLSLFLQIIIVTNSQTAVFDFSSADALKPVNIDNIEGNPDGRVSLNGSIFTSGPITITFENSSNNVEWYKSSIVYLPGDCSIIVKNTHAGCKITRIFINATKLQIDDIDISTIPSIEGGFSWENKANIGTFTPKEDSEYTEIKLTSWAMSNINKITVEYYAEGAGIDNISINHDEEATVYYNTLGHIISNDKLSPGIYICKKGNKTSKVLIK